MSTPEAAIRIFQPLLTPVIAIATVLIFRRQSKTSAYKLKFDLYERRLKVFENIRLTFAEVYTSGVDFKRIANRFGEIRNDAEFLFAYEIKSYMEETFHRANELDGAQKQRRVDIEDSQVKWFREQSQVLPQKFKHALDLSEVTDMPLDINRGFRRLSVLAGLIDLALVLLLRAETWPDSWHTRDYAQAAVLTFTPAAIVLALGWAIAGFRDRNSK